MPKSKNPDKKPLLLSAIREFIANASEDAIMKLTQDDFCLDLYKNSANKSYRNRRGEVLTVLKEVSIPITDEQEQSLLKDTGNGVTRYYKKTDDIIEYKSRFFLLSNNLYPYKDSDIERVLNYISDYLKEPLKTEVRRLVSSDNDSFQKQSNEDESSVKTENFQNQSEVPTMKEDLSNVIYYGVPGTGKTYTIQQDYINNAQKEENTITTTFHQSFSYEEFVEGIKAKVNPDTKQVEYNVEPGIFYKACEKAAKLAGFNSIIEMIEDSDRVAKIQSAIEDGKIVYFCIDEINRGNIASIFGELISLIEVSKRCGADPKTELVVTLPYSGKEFAVPANLKIIGTMNTADRSIQLLDSALRRRFRFIECQPEYSGYNQKAAGILKAMNNRIRALLGKDYQIGHAYFMNISDENADFEIFECLRDKIIPLLEEYFYGETQKIRMVLNEYDNSPNPMENNFYIEDTEANSSLGDDEETIQLFRLNENLSSVKADHAKDFIDHIE